MYNEVYGLWNGHCKREYTASDGRIRLVNTVFIYGREYIICEGQIRSILPFQGRLLFSTGRIHPPQVYTTFKSVYNKLRISPSQILYSFFSGPYTPFFRAVYFIQHAVLPLQKYSLYSLFQGRIAYFRVQFSIL